MTRGAYFLRKREFLFLWCIAVGAVWAQPAAGQESRADVGVAGQVRIARSPKLSPLLAGALERLDSAGVTRGTAEARDMEQFSTLLVRLNPRGEIQVEIEVERLDDAALGDLQARGVTIEHANTEHRLVQGWAPFDLLESLAQLDNVKRIRPPAYATPRSRSVVPTETNRR